MKHVSKKLFSGPGVRCDKAVRQLGFMLASLAIHTLLAALLLFTKPTTHFNSDTITPTDITITIKSFNEPQALGTSTQTKQNFPSKQVVGVIPKAFVPRWDTNYLTGLAVKSGAGTAGLLMPFGHGSGDLGKLEQFSIYDLLYRNIDELLVFPSVLAENNFEGTVNVQTILKSSGEIDWSSFKISGANEYFQIYILRVLKTIFAQPLRPEYKRHLKETQPLDMSFTFALKENGEKTYNDKNRFIMGHVLAFHKYSHQSSMQWKFGPLYGIFPLPYVNLNIGWIIKKINSNDPLAQFMSSNKL